MSYRGQRYSSGRYDRGSDYYQQSSWESREKYGDRYGGQGYSSSGRGGRYSESRSVDPSAQLAAANAILNAVLQTQRSPYRRDRRERSPLRGSYRSRGYSRGRSYRGARSFRSRPYEDVKSRERESRTEETKKDEEETEENAEKKEGDTEEKKEEKKIWKYSCHICRKHADTEEEHLEHCESDEHEHKMEERKARYRRQIQAIVFKLRKREEIDERYGGHGRRGFCTTCNVNFYGINARHNNSPLHRDMKNLKQAYCRFCDLRFVERIDYDRHILTIKHLKIRTKKLSTEEQLKPEDMEVLDSVGEEDDVDEDLDYPEEWDGEMPLGKQCVKKVVGFFCKLCCKFFTEEETNLDDHCKEEHHYTKFVDYAETKKKEILKKKEEKAAEEEAAASKETAIADETVEESKEKEEEKETVEPKENGDITGENDEPEDVDAIEEEEEEIMEEVVEDEEEEEMQVEEEKEEPAAAATSPRRGRGRGRGGRGRKKST